MFLKPGTGLHEVHSEVRKGAHSKGSDKEACGDRHPHLLPLSVGLTLIHWSHDPELLAWSRPGALWSICRIALLIVGISSVHVCPMISACSTQEPQLYYRHLAASSGFLPRSLSLSVSLTVSSSLFSFYLCIFLTLYSFFPSFHWTPLFVSAVSQWEEDDGQTLQTLRGVIRPQVIIWLTQEKPERLTSWA